MRSRPELLSVLDLPPDASAREIRRAFRRLVLDLHPDRRGGDPRSAARLRCVLDAYHSLVGTVRPRLRRARPVPVRRGPLVCPRCEDSYGAPGECPRCALPVVPLGSRAPAPADPAVEAMEAALEAGRAHEVPAWLAPRIPGAAISALLMSGALALSIHGPVATMLVGYGLLLLVGETVGQRA